MTSIVRLPSLLPKELDRCDVVKAANWISLLPSANLADWNRAHANAAFIEDHDASVVQGCLDRRQVCEQQRNLLLWAAARIASKQDERGFRIVA